MGNLPFDESALRISPSPPPSQGSNSASSMVESKYLTRVRILHYIRLGLYIVFIALGTSVIASEGHALHSYNSTHLNSEWWLPLWPQHFDLRPTVTLLVGAAIVVFASLLYVVIAFIPSPRSHTTLLNGLATLTTFLSVLASLLTLAYTAHLNHVNHRLAHDSLQSWTCRWAQGVSASDIAASAGASSSSSTVFGSNGGITAPKGFGRICTETKAAWNIVIAMVVLEGVVGGLCVLAGWWFQLGVWRERRREGKFGKKFQHEEWVMHGKEEQPAHGVAQEV